MADGTNYKPGKMVKPQHRTNKRAIEIYKDGKLVGTFESQQQAAHELNLHEKNLSFLINRKIDSHRGYTAKRPTSSSASM